MRTPYARQLTILVIAFALLLAWVAVPALNEFGSPPVKIGLIGSIGMAGLVVYLLNLRRRLAEGAAGRAREDEFTHLAQLNAGHAAFMMSMVLWMAIFATQGMFDSTRTMLGAGILGQCGFYGICLIFFKSSAREVSMKTRLKELRASRDLTQQALADLVGVRRETVVFLERGRYVPSLRLAYDVARVFELAIEEVFSFDDEREGI